MKSAHVVMNRPAVEAGLSALDAGGDFADGVIAYEGNWLGAEEFVSFDSKAVSMLKSQGNRARNRARSLYSAVPTLHSLQACHLRKVAECQVKPSGPHQGRRFANSF